MELAEFGTVSCRIGTEIKTDKGAGLLLTADTSRQLTLGVRWRAYVGNAENHGKICPTAEVSEGTPGGGVGAGAGMKADRAANR